MKKIRNLKRLLSAILVSALLFASNGFPVRADDEPGAPAGEAVPDEAEVYVEDGMRAPGKEYGTGSTVSVIPPIDAAATSVSDADVSSGTFSDTFFVATGTGSESTISGTSVSLGATAVGGSGGPAVSVGTDAFVMLDDVDITVDGSERYAAYVVENGKLVVRNSSLETTGAAEGDGGTEPASNAALLIYGMSRTNMSVGQSQTYYLNSSAVAEGWAALSTDSATGDGLDLYAYNTYSEATNGGYGTYADTDCRVHLYGSSLQSPEIGAIISKNGSIEALDGSAVDATTASYLGPDDPATEAGTLITGGRNAVMLHAPDMMGEGLRATDTGTLTVKGSSLMTDAALADAAVTDYAEKYGEAVGAYVDHVRGSTVLVKSTSANISLDGAGMGSYSGVLVHTVLNNDGMGNFLAEGDADDASVDNVNVTMSGMDVAGDILHEDYQRYMYLSLDSTELQGAVVSGTYDSWTSRWSGYGDVSWLPDDSWDTVNGTHMALANGSVWTVTGTSTLSSLTVDSSSSIIGAGGSPVGITVDGARVSLEKIIGAGTVSGEITITAGAGDASWVIRENDPDVEERILANSAYVVDGLDTEDVSDDTVTDNREPSEQGTSAYTSSSENGASAIYVTNLATAEFDGITASGNGTMSDEDSRAELASKYGYASAVLVNNGATLTLNNPTIYGKEGSTANGAFASDAGTTLYLNGGIIETNNSLGHGLDATYGGTIFAEDLDIHTQGPNSAAIATDFQGGYITADGVTAVTEYAGSPGIYTAGDSIITVSNSTFTANGTEGVMVAHDGGYTYLYDTDVTGTVGLNSHNSMVSAYSYLEMYGGGLASTGGDLIAVSGGMANMTLDGVETTIADGYGFIGAGEGSLVVNARNMDGITGDVTMDGTTYLELNLADSTLQGTVNANTLTLAGSTWIVTGTSYVDELTLDENSTIIDSNGGTISITADGKPVSVAKAIETGTLTGKIVISTVRSLKINGSTIITLSKNNTQQLGLSTMPSEAMVPVIWTSSNLSIATVDENGLLTARNPGTAIIMATTVDGKLNSNITVRVTP